MWFYSLHISHCFYWFFSGLVYRPGSKHVSAWQWKKAPNWSLLHTHLPACVRVTCVRVSSVCVLRVYVSVACVRGVVPAIRCIWKHLWGVANRGKHYFIAWRPTGYGCIPRTAISSSNIYFCSFYLWMHFKLLNSFFYTLKIYLLLWHSNFNNYEMRNHTSHLASSFHFLNKKYSIYP